MDQLDTGSMHTRLELDKERIKIPELLFNPLDLGLNQKGLVECIKEVIKSMHSDIGGFFLKNIILYGGNTLFPNFKERL